MSEKKKKRELPLPVWFVKTSGMPTILLKYVSISFVFLLIVFESSILPVTFRANYPFLKEGITTVAKILEVQRLNEKVGCCTPALEVTYIYEYQEATGIQSHQETRIISSTQYEKAEQNGGLVVVYVDSNPTHNSIGEIPNTWTTYITVFLLINLSIIFFIFLGIGAHRLQHYEKESKKFEGNIQ